MTKHSTTKHLGAGSSFPKLTEKLRLYSMIFCPFAERARLVLAAKNIPYETVNINLSSKPDWYVKLNPLGQVPCLHFDNDKVIPESLIVCDYLDAVYPENKLTPSDPYIAAMHKLIIDAGSKLVAAFFKVLLGTDIETHKALNEQLESFEHKLKSDYFGGDKPAMVDYMLWPFFERLPVLVELKDFKLNEAKLSKIIAYIERMKKQPAVKEMVLPFDLMVKFNECKISGEVPDYDSGLKLIES